MKTIIAALALATAIASPAFAQSYDPSVGSGNLTAQYNAPAAQQLKLHNSVLGAYARVGNGAPVVGRSIQRQDGFRAYDPDPNIRFQLNREAEEGIN
jgi:hypothetical protein